jgi:hypothetical protein
MYRVSARRLQGTAVTRRHGRMLVSSDRHLLSRFAVTGYVLSLMEHIEASESSGLGSAGFSAIAFKGGWGPNPAGAYLARQSAIIDPGASRGVAVSVIAFPSSGSFRTEIDMLNRAGDWLRRELSPRRMEIQDASPTDIRMFCDSSAPWRRVS